MSRTTLRSRSFAAAVLSVVIGCAASAGSADSSAAIAKNTKPTTTKLIKINFGLASINMNYGRLHRRPERRHLQESGLRPQPRVDERRSDGRDRSRERPDADRGHHY